MLLHMEYDSVEDFTSDVTAQHIAARQKPKQAPWCRCDNS